MRVSKVSLWHLRPSSDARPRVFRGRGGARKAEEVIRKAVGTGMDGRIHR